MLSKLYTIQARPKTLDKLVFDIEMHELNTSLSSKLEWTVNGHMRKIPETNTNELDNWSVSHNQHLEFVCIKLHMYLLVLFFSRLLCYRGRLKGCIILFFFFFFFQILNNSFAINRKILFADFQRFFAIFVRVCMCLCVFVYNMFVCFFLCIICSFLDRFSFNKAIWVIYRIYIVFVSLNLVLLFVVISRLFPISRIKMYLLHIFQCFVLRTLFDRLVND